MTIDEMIQSYRAIKDQKTEIENRHKTELERIKTVMAKLEGAIHEVLKKNGINNAKTKYGTAYVSTKWSSSLVDPDAFMSFVVDSGEWNLLDRKSNVKAVRAYEKEHKELPPGAKLASRSVVHVIKAGAEIPSDDED
jgi:hypothetical protein